MNEILVNPGLPLSDEVIPGPGLIANPVSPSPIANPSHARADTPAGGDTSQPAGGTVGPTTVSPGVGSNASAEDDAPASKTDTPPSTEEAILDGSSPGLSVIPISSDSPGDTDVDRIEPNPAPVSVPGTMTAVNPKTQETIQFVEEGSPKGTSLPLFSPPVTRARAARDVRKAPSPNPPVVAPRRKRPNRVEPPPRRDPSPSSAEAAVATDDSSGPLYIPVKGRRGPSRAQPAAKRRRRK